MSDQSHPALPARDRAHLRAGRPSSRGAARRLARPAAGRDRGPGRPVRQRQVDLAAYRGPAGAARRRRGDGGRPLGRHARRSRADDAATPVPGLRLPVSPPAAGILGARERDAATDAERSVARRRRVCGRRSCCRWSSSWIAATTGRVACRAASSSGWRSRGRSPMRRACCWPTNRPAISMPRRPRSVFRQLLTLVRETGMAALVATHNPELAARMDRTVTLKDGVLSS